MCYETWLCTGAVRDKNGDIEVSKALRGPHWREPYSVSMQLYGIPTLLDLVARAASRPNPFLGSTRPPVVRTLCRCVNSYIPPARRTTYPPTL